jgi:hypothetical protein
MSMLSPEKLNANSIPTDEDDMTWHDPPSSPFVAHVENDQENIAPNDAAAPTPAKSLINFDDDAPQSAFKASPSHFGLKERTSPVKMSPSKQLLDELEDGSFRRSVETRASPKKSSPMKQIAIERPESAMSERSRKSASPSKSSRNISVEPTPRFSESTNSAVSDERMSPIKRPSSRQQESGMRENEGLTIAMKIMEETRSESHQSSSSHHTNKGTLDQDEVSSIEEADFNPDGPELTSLDIDDTGFSMFSEMPNLDMTKFAVLKNSPTKSGLFDQVFQSPPQHIT